MSFEYIAVVLFVFILLLICYCCVLIGYKLRRSDLKLEGTYSTAEVINTSIKIKQKEPKILCQDVDEVRITPVVEKNGIYLERVLNDKVIDRRLITFQQLVKDCIGYSTPQKM